MEQNFNEQIKNMSNEDFKNLLDEFKKWDNIGPTVNDFFMFEMIYGEGYKSREDFVNQLLNYCLTESDYKNKKNGYTKLINRIADLKEEIAHLRDQNQKLGEALKITMPKQNIPLTVIDDILNNVTFYEN